MKKWIVTGATGFIGRNLISHLSRDHEVVAVMHHASSGRLFDAMPHVKAVVCPMEEYGLLEDRIPENTYDVFCHLAWAGTKRAARADYAVQSANARFVCDAALASKRLGCRRFLVAGTITERIAADALKRHYVAGHLVYGLSKLYAHKLLSILASREGMDYVWAQLGNIYGRGDETGNLLSYTVKELAAGRVPTYGPCQQPINFTYIDDVIAAFQILGEAGNLPKQTYFVSNGECRKLVDYLMSVASMLGGDVAIGQREDDGVRYDAAWFHDDGLKELGFSPRYTFEDGVQEMKEWLHGNKV
ncbi:NAD(P)-dependent oxidoreductase [uncultured Selenomonas sp.]|uniref:NAD-dependent epimerase/dehydratase family protein n=1 Tax=uncultured Selenomonas sp. TaxID=159275 RepID=UPI0025FBD9DE|nr:NAD(P)-dependent oxidoreductase [uncultured Selenomonas sp.]